MVCFILVKILSIFSFQNLIALLPNGSNNSASGTLMTIAGLSLVVIDPAIAPFADIKRLPIGIGVDINVKITSVQSISSSTSSHRRRCARSGTSARATNYLPFAYSIRQIMAFMVDALPRFLPKAPPCARMNIATVNVSYYGATADVTAPDKSRIILFEFLSVCHFHCPF